MARSILLRFIKGFRLRPGSRKVPYEPLRRPFIESIFSRGFELAETRREFDLGKGAIAEAKKLSKKIGEELASRIPI